MFAAFRLLSLGWQAAIIGGVLLAVVGAGAAIRYSIYQSGREAERAATERKDREAIDAANKGGDRPAECRASGGVWRPSTGECERR